MNIQTHKTTDTKLNKQKKEEHILTDMYQVRHVQRLCRHVCDKKKKLNSTNWQPLK